MQTIFAIFATIAMAAAWESSTPSATPAPAPEPIPAASCADGNVIACCDTTGGDGLLGNVLGGSCIVPNLISISNNCASGNTFCCPTNQDGELNIAAACIPISA